MDYATNTTTEKGVETDARKISDFFNAPPKQRVADICGADDPMHLHRVLVANQRARLGDLGERDQSIVHRFMMLMGAIELTDVEPRDDDSDDEYDLDFELLLYDEILEDLEEWPVSQAELAEANRLSSLMKDVLQAARSEGWLRGRAERGPGAYRDRQRCDGFSRSRQGGTRQRESRGGKPTRSRGSRRTTACSAGGGSSGDDPPGDSAEPPSRRRGREPNTFSAVAS